MIFEDQLAALEADSKRVGTQGQEIDFALLVDGLAAEREQGITIDVAYRFFATEKRKFIVADTPGPRAIHPQHGHRRLDRRPRGDPDRRAQGRAVADPAAQLPRAPARHPQHRAGGEQDGPGRLRPGGVRRRSSPTTRRSPAASASTTSPRSRSRASRATTSPAARPNTPWYEGPTLIEHLGDGRGRRHDRCRPSRSACRCNGSTAPTSTSAASPGLIASGTRQAGRCGARAALGQDLARSTRIVTLDGDLDEAVAGQSVTLTLRRRDRLLARRRDRRRRAIRRRPPTSSRRRSSGWTTTQLLPGRAYWLKLGTQTVSATVQAPKYQINVNTHGASGGQDAGAQRDRRRRTSPPTGRSCSSPMPTTATLGGFILIDKMTNATVAAGHDPLRAAPRAERPLAGDRHRPRASRRAQEPEARGAVVHRPVGRGQVDHRQPGREEAARG